MHHMAFEGGLGTGKTLMATVIANWWREQAAKKNVDVQLFANFDMRGATRMSTYESWYDVADADVSIIIWDESQVHFNNRAWSQFGQNIVTQIAMYVRKMRSIQIYATPSVNMLDSRIRSVLEVVVKMQKTKAGYQLNFYDYQTNQFLRKAFVPMSKAKKIYKLNLYDTYSFVTPVPMPSDERSAKKFWAELNAIHEKKIGRSMINVNPFAIGDVEIGEI